MKRTFDTMEKAAGCNGMAGGMMGAGMGVGMGQQMAGMMGGAMGQQGGAAGHEGVPALQRPEPGRREVLRQLRQGDGLRHAVSQVQRHGAHGSEVLPRVRPEHGGRKVPQVQRPARARREVLSRVRREDRVGNIL